MSKAFSVTTKNNKGFTLVELIIVISVLSIIAVIAVPKFPNIIKTSKEKANKENVRILKNAVKLAMTNGDFMESNDLNLSNLNEENLLKYYEDEENYEYLEDKLVDKYIDKIPDIDYQSGENDSDDDTGNDDENGNNDGSNGDDDNNNNNDKYPNWEKEKVYYRLDIVMHDGKKYICIKTHPSTKEWGHDKYDWVVFEDWNKDNGDTEYKRNEIIVLYNSKYYKYIGKKPAKKTKLPTPSESQTQYWEVWS